MKKLFLTAALLSVSVLSYSQAIQNSGFENWSPRVYFQEPEHFFTPNLYSYISADTSCVQQTTDHVQGLYGCRLQTFTGSTGDTLNGIALTGVPSGGGVSGGVPFGIRADTICGFFKYNVMPGDTATYIVIFKNNGAVLGMAGIPMTGTQMTYTLKKTAVTWLLPFSPDTAVVILSSSNINNHMAHPGSILIADSLYVKLGSVSTSLPNGNFENWITTGFDEPDYWNTSNFIQVGSSPSVTKSTDAHSGMYACRIESVTSSLSNDTLGLVSNGEITSVLPDGGMSVWLNPDIVSGYYKYTPAGGPDSALFLVMTHRYESTLGIRINIDSVMLKLPAASVYTPFQIQLPYNSWPFTDSVCISFSSANITDNSNYTGLGSVLLIDDLNITYKPAAVGESELLRSRIWPVPASEILTLSLNTPSDKGTFTVSEPGGKIVLSVNLPERCTQFPVSVDGLKPGMYLYTVSSGGKTSNGKIIIR